MFRLSISQRQCRFTNEAETMASSPVYSYNLCKIECRKQLAIQKCGCIPHFYRATGKKRETYKICDFSGLVCLLHIKGGCLVFSNLADTDPNSNFHISDALITLKSKIFQIHCDCLTNCDDSKFYVQSYVSQKMKTNNFNVMQLICYLAFQSMVLRCQSAVGLQRLPKNAVEAEFVVWIHRCSWYGYVVTHNS